MLQRRKAADATGGGEAAAPPTACVAIAATLGAEAALNALVARLAPGAGACFVLTFPSEAGLPPPPALEAIRRAASLPLSLVASEVRLQCDHIYVVRGDQLATVTMGRLHVRSAGPKDGGIDSLLVSASQAYGEAAVMVVLRGLGAEAAAAAAAAKTGGGFLIAEAGDEELEPERQAFGSAGLADLRLPAEQIGPAISAYLASQDAGGSQDEHVLRLEAELRVTRQRLQTATEALKASDEGYRSIREELQSASAELETSKAKLQAVNEQLQTVNGELAHRVGELARANSDLKNLLESTQIATVFLDNDLRLRSFTPASTDIFHVSAADVGRPIAHVGSRISYPELPADARKVLESLDAVEREVASAEEDRQFLVRVLPYRSVDNFIAGVVVTFLEITGATRAEAALRASERRFGEAQQLAGVGVWEWNLETDETWWSPAVYPLWGLPPADSPPPPSKRPMHPEDREAYAAACEAARTSGERNIEWRVLLPDGSVRWLVETGRMERAGSGRRMLGVVQDVTRRKQTETRLTMLLGELQHRVRNILGVVRSVVARTVRSAGSVDELAASLYGRLDALARTQGVFARSGVTAIDLEDVIRDELVAVAAREDQLDVAGPHVRLRREAAEAMALALHELTTNAVKYGALSEPKGRLSIHWRVLDTGRGLKLMVDWRESGVRALPATPSRCGFGRELIERGLPYELGASTSLEFARGGVRASIELPLTDKIADLDTPREAHDAEDRP